jgi:hypothetical protein
MLGSTVLADQPTPAVLSSTLTTFYLSWGSGKLILGTVGCRNSFMPSIYGETAAPSDAEIGT